MYITYAVLCLVQLLVMSGCVWPHGLQPARLLCPWGFSRQEYWSGLPCPPPRDLLNPGMEPRFPAFQADSLLFEPPGKLSLSLSTHTHTHTHTHIFMYNDSECIDTHRYRLNIYIYMCVYIHIYMCVCVTPWGGWIPCPLKFSKYLWSLSVLGHGISDTLPMTGDLIFNSIQSLSSRSLQIRGVGFCKHSYFSTGQSVWNQS